MVTPVDPRVTSAKPGTILAPAPPLFGEAILRAAVRQIEAHPDRWNQNAFLGTGPYGATYCLAGWVAHLSGMDVEAVLSGPQGTRVLYEHVRALLGLTPTQAGNLFYDFGVGYRKPPSVADLKQRLTDVCGVDFTTGGQRADQPAAAAH